MPGVITDIQIKSRAEYIDNAARTVSILGWGGPFLIETTIKNPASLITIPREDCDLKDDPLANKTQVSLTGIYADEASARAAVAASPPVRAGRADMAVFAFYLGPDNCILPTILSATTIPRLLPALQAMLDREAANAKEASRVLLEAVITLGGLRVGVAKLPSEGEAVSWKVGSKIASAPKGIVTRVQMLKYVLDVWKRTPLLKRLQLARTLTGPAQQRELLEILAEFERTSGVAVQRVPTGTVQAARGSGNLASLRSRPGVLQIEEQVFQNTGTLLTEITHELPFYYSGMQDQLVFGSFKAHQFLEWMITDGEQAVISFLNAP